MQDEVALFKFTVNEVYATLPCSSAYDLIFKDDSLKSKPSGLVPKRNDSD